MTIMDLNIILSLIAVALLMLSFCTFFTHIGLILRLGIAIFQGRTRWPGPKTHFSSQREAIDSVYLQKPVPHLYPRYLTNAFTLLLSIFLFFMPLKSLITLPQPLLFKSHLGIIIMMTIASVAYLIGASDAIKYDAEVEWALSQSPRTPISTDEPSNKVAHDFAAIRKANRRIWTIIFFILLSCLLIWYFITNFENKSLQLALLQPQITPITNNNIEAVANKNAAFYFPSPGGSTSTYPIKSFIIQHSFSPCLFKTTNGIELLAIRLKNRSLDELIKMSKNGTLEAIVYSQQALSLFPQLKNKWPCTLVILGKKEELIYFSKHNKEKGILLSLILICFSIFQFFIFQSLKRWKSYTISKYKK